MAQANSIMIVAGILTMLQAVGQALFNTLGLLQYFCVIDFLRQRPLLLYIKILYFHNPSVCGAQINIGQSIDGMPNQAFVLLTREPFTSTRTFFINSSSLGLTVLWLFTCFGLMSGGAKNKQSKPIRWPWIIVTSVMGALDLGATVTYANDSFNTKTLSEIMEFIGGTTSGTGNLELNTRWAAWVMVILYSRFAILFLLNILLIILVVTSISKKGQVNESVETPDGMVDSNSNDQEEDKRSSPSVTLTKIPRPGLSHSFRLMKARLFNRTPSTVVRLESGINGSPRFPQAELASVQTRGVRALPDSMSAARTIFPDQPRLETLLAEQRKRLSEAVVDTAGRRSPPKVLQSLPQETNSPEHMRGRRGTAAELQGQLPWAYIPAPAHRMRDQLPPDEDLPPVPLQDYTALPSDRKASVHRAASSLSSLTWKRGLKYLRPPLNRSDVLY